MAREIKPTPGKGKEPKRFMEAVDNLEPLSKEEFEKLDKAYNLAKKRKDARQG
jgi:hypothetical protein